MQTLPQPPYTIGYNGALFREYPGPWQVMFKQQSGVYACVAERPERYALGEFKEELMEQLGLNTEEKGSALEFLRKGYKVCQPCHLGWGHILQCTNIAFLHEVLASYLTQPAGVHRNASLEYNYQGWSHKHNLLGIC